MANTLGASLQNALNDFLAPLKVASSSTSRLHGLLDMLGLTDAVSSNASVKQIIGNAAALADKIAAFEPGKLDSLDGVQSLVAIGGEARTVLQQLQSIQDPALAGLATTLAEELLALLLASYLRRLHPTAFRVAALLTLIESREAGVVEPAVVQGDSTVRYARVRDRFNFSAIQGLLSSPAQTLKDAYLPNGMATGVDARNGAQQLFPQLAFLAGILGLSWRIDSEPVTPDPTPPPLDDQSLELDHVGSENLDENAVSLPPVPIPDEFYDKYYSTFTLVLRPPTSDGTPGVSIKVMASSLRHPGTVAGYIVTLAGTLNSVDALGVWSLSLSANGQVPAFVVGPTGITLAAGSSPVTDGAAHVLLQSIPPAGSTAPAFILGGADSSRIEVGTLKFATDLLYGPDRKAIEISTDASSAALVIAPGDGDGFLAEIIPADGLRTQFNLGLVLSSDKGLTLRGSAGLEADIPIGLSMAGVSLSSVHLSLQASEGALNAEISAGLSASIGPVRAVLDRIGLAGTLSFPQGGGNLGAANLDLGFKPPSGIGLSVEAQGVLTGGGFLFHDEAQQLYAGVMQLSLHEQITLKAFGLIATRMPDGSRGYSLIIFITAEDFRPIPLGLGFTLQGIGGMVAVHRTFDENALREGLKSDTLSQLLFPRDPVGNAPAIIRALASAFPPMRGSYLLGILARIGWFTPTLIQMDLALILQFGARERLLVLGRISSLLPSPDNDLVRLNLDVMGVLDFDQGTASVDGVLVDSRLVHKFALTGAMAMRARWSSGPGSGFVLAVGGFNPRFAPPAGVPPLARVAIALCSGDNPRLTCEAYFALTSNTVQFGARAALYAAAYGFSVQGDVGYDVLLQIAPLHFIADFHASVQLKHGSSNLFSVSLAGSLEGPRPLRVSGKASFSIFWCDFSVRFDKTLIDGEPPPPPLGVDVLAALKAALSTAQSWTTQLPAERTHGVALRTLTPGTTLILDPLGRLAVKQQVAPLNSARDIDLYGGAPVIGNRRFTLAATLNGQPLQTTQTLRDQFAPAQLFAMSDDEKLAAPSFEQMDAGLVFGSDAVSFDATQLVAANLQYESIVIDAPIPEGAPLPPSQTYVLQPAQLAFHSLTGAAARAPVRRVGRARFRTPDAAPAVSLAKPAWDIVPLDGGAPAPVDPAVRTWSEHLAVLNSLNRAGAHWQLVPANEVTA